MKQGKQQVDPKFKTGGSTTSTGSKMSSCGSMDESSGSLRSGADPPTSLKKKSLVDMVVAEHGKNHIQHTPFLFFGLTFNLRMKPKLDLI